MIVFMIPESIPPLSIATVIICLIAVAVVLVTVLSLSTRVKNPLCKLRLNFFLDSILPKSKELILKSNPCVQFAIGFFLKLKKKIQKNKKCYRLILPLKEIFFKRNFYSYISLFDFKVSKLSDFLNFTFRFLQKLKNENKTFVNSIFNETKAETKPSLSYAYLVTKSFC